MANIRGSPWGWVWEVELGFMLVAWSDNTGRRHTSSWSLLFNQEMKVKCPDHPHHFPQGHNYCYILHSHVHPEVGLLPRTLVLPSKESEEGAASSGYAPSICQRLVMPWFCSWPLLTDFIIKIQVGNIHRENMVLRPDPHLPVEGHARCSTEQGMWSPCWEGQVGPLHPYWWAPGVLIAVTPASRP